MGWGRVGVVLSILLSLSIISIISVLYVCLLFKVLFEMYIYLLIK